MLKPRVKRKKLCFNENTGSKIGLIRPTEGEAGCCLNVSQVGMSLNVCYYYYYYYNYILYHENLYLFFSFNVKFDSFY